MRARDGGTVMEKLLQLRMQAMMWEEDCKRRAKRRKVWTELEPEVPEVG